MPPGFSVSKRGGEDESESRVKRSKRAYVVRDCAMKWILGPTGHTGVVDGWMTHAE